jgi:short-subunit dehydrogenase
LASFRLLLLLNFASSKIKKMKKQKYILVTGASSGLGNALVKELSAKGYSVFAGVRTEKDKQLFQGNNNIIPIILDIAKPENVTSSVQQISEVTKQQGLFALINNAGINYISAFELADENKERQLFEVNLLGAMALTRAVLPLLHKNVSATNTTSKIINVSSMGGFFGLPWEASYHASKFAMIGFSQSLRYELKKLNIDVCCFIPGGMKTNIFKKSIEASTENCNKSHQHFAFYHRNEKHMQTVMQSFDKGSAPVEKPAKVIVKLLSKNKMPLKKYFGMDAKFVRVFTWLGLQNLLSTRFTVK